MKIRKGKKAQKRLEKRIKDYEETIQRLGVDRSSGFKKPGSLRK